MPKNLVIDPNFIRAQGKIEFTDIPVNVYNKSIKDEKENFSKQDFVRIFNDIAMLREFESMINDIKIKNEYQLYQSIADLQLNFIEDYEEIAPKIIKVSYDNNAILYFNMSDKDYKLDEHEIVKSYSLLRK